MTTEGKTNEEGTEVEGEGEEGSEKELTPEQLQERLTELEQENTDLKKSAAKKRTAAAREAKAAKGKVDDDPEKSALQKQLDEERAARSTLEERVNRTAAEKVATAVGAKDAETAILLLEKRGIDISDEDEVRLAARELLKEKPYLKGEATKNIDAGAGGKKTETRSMNDLIRDAAGRGR